MITINYNARITGGVAPYSYEISSNQSCTQITPNVGTTSADIITFSVSYDNQTCLDLSILSIQGTDANGCPLEFTIVPEDACEDLTVDAIAFEAPYSFSVNASRPGCTQGLTFDWIYDTTVFDLRGQFTSSTTSQIILNPKSNVSQFPATSPIQVTVTDCYGCTETVMYNFTFCQPQVQDIVTELFCIEATPPLSDYFERQNVSLLPVTGCTGITIDWSTLQVSNPDPTNIQIVNNEDGTIDIRATQALADSTQNLFYSVRTTDGIQSNQGLITVRVLNCNGPSAIYIQSDVVAYDCLASPGDTVYFYVEDYIVLSPGATIDWSSFTVLAVPSPDSPSITLETDLNGDHRIAYELPDPISTDTFAWSLCTTDGVCAEAAIFTVIECSNGPTAVDDSACSECNETITIDVQANDTAGDTPIVMDSTTITTAPSVGTAIVLSDGTIQYTPPAGYVGTVTLEYTVRDQFGNISDPATVTIEMICAGENSIISVCQ